MAKRYELPDAAWDLVASIFYETCRSRGGLTTKVHMLCDANDIPLKFLLSGGQAGDIA